MAGIVAVGGGEPIYRSSYSSSSSSSPLRLHDSARKQNPDFSDFAFSDSGGGGGLAHPSFDTGGYTHAPSSSRGEAASAHHRDDRRTNSLKTDSKHRRRPTAVNEFDNLTPHSGEVVGGDAAAGSAGDPEARFFVDICAVRQFFGRKKRSAAPLFFWHYGYHRCHNGYGHGNGHGKGYGHGHRKRRK